MMYPHSPSPRQLAVPGIGFPQSISARSECALSGGIPRLVKAYARPQDGRCPDATY